MSSKICMVISSSIILLLGLAHLVFTFSGKKLTPRNKDVQKLMENDSPIISKETTMWRAWVGFNASHSMGAILFGLIYGFMTITQSALLFDSWFLLIVGFAMLVGLVILAKFYWFKDPFIGISLSLTLYILSVVLSRI